ncbi:MAG: response regulator transcription factor [Kouleothrix sp.]|jgi:DNA-binding response OmpR family regulator
MVHILIVDDDWMLVKLTAFLIEDAGYRVTKVFDGRSAMQAITHDMPDLILLDIRLPALSGFDLCREIRHVSNIPIIFVSASNELADRVKALEIGGDDYIVKPFEPAELLARIEAVLRRYDGFRQRMLTQLKCGNLMLDPVDQAVHIEGRRTVELTPIEFQILYVLMQNADRVVSDQTLMQAVWGTRSKGRNVLTVYIYRLRTKVTPEVNAPQQIVTLRGRGYMFMSDAQKGSRTYANAQAVGES